MLNSMPFICCMEALQVQFGQETLAGIQDLSPQRK